MIRIDWDQTDHTNADVVSVFLNFIDRKGNLFLNKLLCEFLYKYDVIFKTTGIYIKSIKVYKTFLNIHYVFDKDSKETVKISMCKYGDFITIVDKLKLALKDNEMDIKYTTIADSSNSILQKYFRKITDKYSYEEIHNMMVNYLLEYHYSHKPTEIGKIKSLLICSTQIDFEICDCSGINTHIYTLTNLKELSDFKHFKFQDSEILRELQIEDGAIVIISNTDCDCPTVNFGKYLLKEFKVNEIRLLFENFLPYYWNKYYGWKDRYCTLKNININYNAGITFNFTLKNGVNDTHVMHQKYISVFKEYVKKLDEPIKPKISLSDIFTNMKFEYG